MALAIPENSFSGSLDDSDSNESERSESYAMYLNVGDSGYSVSTAVIGDDVPVSSKNGGDGPNTIDTGDNDANGTGGAVTTRFRVDDPFKGADTENDATATNARPHVGDATPRKNISALVSCHAGTDIFNSSYKGDVLSNIIQPESRHTTIPGFSAGGVDGWKPDESGDNTSDTEDYSIHSDQDTRHTELDQDLKQISAGGNQYLGNTSELGKAGPCPDVNQQFTDSKTELLKGMGGNSFGSQKINNGVYSNDMMVSIKTEPLSPVSSDCGSPAGQCLSQDNNTTGDTMEFSPSKAFSLRLNLFGNKSESSEAVANPTMSAQKLDFSTLDNVIAAAVSKTYNSTESCVKRRELAAGDGPPMGKPVEATRSGVVVVDLPLHIEGKLFHSCSVCHKLFKTPKELRVHSRVHTNEKPYACYVCGKAFRQQAHLNSHYKIHSGEKPYSCNLCSLSFTENSSLKRHIRNHLGIKPYKCNECDDAFVTSYLLKTHKTRRHEDKQNRTRFTCTRCPKIYTSKETFNKHLRSHDPDTRISCPHCGQVCLTSSHLKRHVNVHTRTDMCNLQTKDKPFECGICQKKYFNKKHLELHVVRHTEKEYFPCDSCDKGFDTRYKWKRHVRRSHYENKEPSISTKSKEFRCLICNKLFRSIENREAHVQRVHDKPVSYSCDQCDRTFVRRDTMLNHKESHLGQTFQCELCDRNYSTSTTLKKHMRKKHKTEKSRGTTGKTDEIICDFCHRAFCNKASLKEHVRTRHSDSLEFYPCPLCQMKFTRRNSMTRHMKKSCRMLGTDGQKKDVGEDTSDTSADDHEGPDSMCRTFSPGPDSIAQCADDLSINADPYSMVDSGDMDPGQDCGELSPSPQCADSDEGLSDTTDMDTDVDMPSPNHHNQHNNETSQDEDTIRDVGIPRVTGVSPDKVTLEVRSESVTKAFTSITSNDEDVEQSSPCDSAMVWEQDDNDKSPKDSHDFTSSDGLSSPVLAGQFSDAVSSPVLAGESNDAVSSPILAGNFNDVEQQHAKH